MEGEARGEDGTTVCPQCSTVVRFKELEDHLLAHEINEEDQVRMTKPDILAVLGSGVETAEPRVEGVIPVLERCYTRHRPVGVTSVSLSTPTTHIRSEDWDVGWGCGYRNIQMVFSGLLQLEPYSALLKEKGFIDIPNIPKIQDMIEEAWSLGFDAKGCKELSGRVKGTKKWIGTTEAASVFRMLNIRAEVVDFAEPSGPSGTHPLLMEWVSNYYRTGNPSLLNHKSNIDKENDDCNMVKKEKASSTEKSAKLPDDVDLPPLYFQHEGHSRTIVGIEHQGREPNLLVLDPLHSLKQLHKFLMKPASSLHLLRKTANQLRHKEYEIVFMDGTLTDEEKEAMKVIVPYQRFPK